jgi:hypothetical protein
MFIIIFGVGYGNRNETNQYGEMAESAEGARLLSECTPKSVPRVRIPLSPPLFTSHNSYNSQPTILTKP